MKEMPRKITKHGVKNSQLASPNDLYTNYIGYNYWWKSKITANFAGIVWQESRSLPLLSVFLRLVLGNFQAQAVGNYVHNVPLGFSRLWVFCFGEFRKKYFVENNISIARAAVKLPRLFLYLILIHMNISTGPPLWNFN